MSTTSRRRIRRIARLAVVPLAIVGSTVAIANASYSAFSSTTVNPTNNWTTGSVALTDDDSNTAMFNATGLKSGDTGTKCISVTSTGSLPSTVKLYGTGYTSTGSPALGANITLAVSQGTGGSSSSCTGFTGGTSIYSGTLEAFGTTKTSFATGVGTWAPTGSGSESRTYQFTYTVGASAPQGASTSIGFTWEAQNS